ncbi:MAG: hypothetical protein P8L28_07965 [Flavobacteriaceae bacterium]|nr:hypothetical protein [Flavobacteriaceae bacterium]
MRFNLAPLKILLCIAFFISCTDNLNFDNINLDLEPVVNIPIVYFELNQNNFIDENDQEISVVSDITVFRILETTILKENLVELKIDFEVENGFNRMFLVNMFFLDDDNNITYTVDEFIIDAGDLNYSTTRTILIETTPEFLNSTRFRTDVILPPASTNLNPAIEKVFKFRSLGTFYLRF